MVGYARILERWPNSPSQNFCMEEGKHISKMWMGGCLGRPGHRKQFAQNYSYLARFQTRYPSQKPSLPSCTYEGGVVGFQSWLTHARTRLVHIVLVGRVGGGNSTSPSADGKVGRERQGPTKAGSV